jgi:hypothetical protein
MAATIIEEQNCRACGVDIREGALFCYNCGGAVTYDDSVSGNDKAMSDAWFREEIADESSAEKSTNVETAEKTQNAVRKKPGKYEAARLRSAATLRRKSKSFQKRKVEEVVWEEYEDSSNSSFVIVAVVLAVLSTLIFLLAVYLK